MISWSQPALWRILGSILPAAAPLGVVAARRRVQEMCPGNSLRQRGQRGQPASVFFHHLRLGAQVARQLGVIYRMPATGKQARWMVSHAGTVTLRRRTPVRFAVPGCRGRYWAFSHDRIATTPLRAWYSGLDEDFQHTRLLSPLKSFQGGSQRIAR